MAEYDFSDRRWLGDREKPVDRLLPFRRIRVPPAHRFVTLPSQTKADGPFVRPDGKGYECGCRSTKDYDGKIGQDLGRAIGNFLSAFTGHLVDAAKAGLKGLLSKAQNIPLIGPGVRKVIDAIDEVDDPIRFLIGQLGKAIDALLVDSIIRGLPSWVPALRRDRTALRNEEQEVDGVLIFSRLRHDSIPFAQWHHWYDWSFDLVPSPFFEAIVGEGNSRRSSEDTPFEKDSPNLRRYEIGHQLFSRGRATDFHVECELDLGAFTDFDVTEKGRPEVAFLNPPPADPRGGRFWRTDWGWPQAGQYFWASGRSVYDCSHATTDDKTTGLHLNQLHPCKAIASARWEGFQFLENERAVPAIQFTFFATNVRRSGGDFLFGLSDITDPRDRGKFNLEDYDFIIDLPEPPPPGDSLDQDAELPGTPDPIGPGPTFINNTLVLRPRLLIDVNFDRFEQRAGDIERSVRPLVEPVPPTEPGRVPRQVRVRIPFKQIPVSDQFNTYAVMLTLGWHDPKGLQFKKVRKVTVRFKRLTYLKPDDVKAERWVVNLGVNGRWMSLAFDPRLLPTDPVPLVRTHEDLAIAPVELFLADDDLLLISANGFAENLGTVFNKPEIARDSNGQPVDEGGENPPPDTPISVLTDIQDRFLTDRRLRFSREVKPPKITAQGREEGLVSPFIGRVAQWNRKQLARGGAAGPDIDQVDGPGDAKAKNAKASELARQLFLRIGVEGGFHANRPIGLIDPMLPDPTRKAQSERAFNGGDTANPLRVGDIPLAASGKRELTGRLTAYHTELFGRMGTLVLDPKQGEYQLGYTVTVEDQPKLPQEIGLPAIQPATVRIRSSATTRPGIVPGSVRLTAAAGPPTPGVRPNTVTITRNAGPGIRAASVRLARR